MRGKPLDAYGYYQTLIRYFSDYEQVASGEALYRSAEILYGARDIPEATKAYERLVSNYANHPKGKKRDDADSANNRLKKCADLQRLWKK